MKKRLVHLLALAVSLLWASSALATTITVDYLTSLDAANDPAWNYSSDIGGFIGPSSFGNTQSGISWTMTAHNPDSSLGSLDWIDYKRRYGSSFTYPLAWFNGLAVTGQGQPFLGFQFQGTGNQKYLELSVSSSNGSPVYLTSLTFGNVGQGETYSYMFIYGNGSNSGWTSEVGTNSPYPGAGQIIKSLSIPISGVRLASGQESAITFQGFSLESQSSPPDPNPTPEPGTLALMASALGTGLWLRRRRRAKHGQAPTEGPAPS
ncbi:MAG: PEP-CTERM sorting domain-containing protein [Desulfarculus sp.]|nr:PEP-CTERM sorting domain-containing protein [Desulfarculus sp.]